MQSEVINNINSIRNRINEACLLANRDAKKVTLIAVSKKKNHKLIETAFKHGVNNFGENYAQELKQKSELIKSNKIIWHFIGPLQSNKVKLIANYADWVHSLDREKVIKKLNSECQKINKTINAFIQVNISNEKTKNGCNPENLEEIVKLVESMENINLKGLMALPKITNNKNERKNMMRSIKDLSIKLQSINKNANGISLGTTSDFEDAIANGSTALRIGESIFGKRS